MSNLQNPIRIYDSSLNLVGELDDYSSAYFTRSWYGIGDFSIQINKNMVHSGDLQKGRFVMFDKDVYRLGLITKLDSKVGQEGKGSEIITASGFEVKFIYSWRIVLPQTSSATYTLTNSAETVMKTLVKDQCGSTADADRRFTLMNIGTDLDRGSTYVLNVRYNSTVADELQKISMASEVGYFIYLDEANKKLIFEISEGLDRTATQSVNPRAIFSKDYDTLKSASFSTSDNQYRNYAYTAGQGIGVLRTVREIYNTPTEPTSFDRKEIFIDARDLTGTGDIDARAAQKLGEYAIQLTVDGAPLTYSPLVYRTDYDLGDIVTIQALGTTYDARITSVKESWSPLVYDIDVTFDKEPASLPLQTSRAIESVKSNIQATGTDGDIVTVAAVARYTGGTWTIIDDTDHTPLHVASIADAAGGYGFKITYDFTAKEVLSLVATVDETYANLGYNTGGSIGLNISNIVVSGRHTSLIQDTRKAFWFRRSGSVYGYVYWNGSAWTSSDSAGITSYSFNTGTGVLTINHSSAGFTEVNVTPRYWPNFDEAVFVSYGATTTQIQFYNYGNIPNTQVEASGANIWILGKFKV